MDYVSLTQRKDRVCGNEKLMSAAGPLDCGCEHFLEEVSSRHACGTFGCLHQNMQQFEGKLTPPVIRTLVLTMLEPLAEGSNRT